jgi:hypothetical protein
MPRRRSSPKPVGCLVHKTRKGVRCHKGVGETDERCVLRSSGRCAMKKVYRKKASHQKFSLSSPSSHHSMAKHMKFSLSSPSSHHSMAKHMKFSLSSPSSTKRSSSHRHMRFSPSSSSGSKGCAFVSKGTRSHCSPYSGPNDPRCKRSSKGRCIKL